ncbi:hypothetical protein Bbelb_009540 [Branchiostoma belcheri]|nr:hypothetical protein Bbelb_009540 [Branchiostoma belcheri]
MRAKCIALPLAEAALANVFHAVNTRQSPKGVSYHRPTIADHEMWRQHAITHNPLGGSTDETDKNSPQARKTTHRTKPTQAMDLQGSAISVMFSPGQNEDTLLQGGENRNSGSWDDVTGMLRKAMLTLDPSALTAGKLLPGSLDTLQQQRGGLTGYQKTEISRLPHTWENQDISAAGLGSKL